MTIQEGNPQLADDLKALIQDAEELLKATAGDAGEKVKDARSRLTRAIESAKTTCGQLPERTAQAARAADVAIRGHVYETIGVAFGVGLLIGVLVGRR